MKVLILNLVHQTLRNLQYFFMAELYGILIVNGIENGKFQVSTKALEAVEDSFL